MLIGFKIQHWSLLIPVVLLMLLVSLLFTALGTLIATKLDDMQGFQLIVNFLVMPLFFLSGAIFPLTEGLPKVLIVLSRIDPLAYGIDAFRSLLDNMSAFGIGLDIGVLSVITLILLALGSYSFSKMQV